MKTKEKESILRSMLQTVTIIIAVIMVFSLAHITAFAGTGKTEVPGKVYEFDKDSHYEFSENKDFLETVETNAYGTFSISGDISDVSTKNGVPTYDVTEGNISFYYSYGNSLLSADEDSWHLIDDKSKKVDGQTLDSNILKGAIILQTSNDRKNWLDVYSETNAFSETSIRTESIYTTTDVQLINGCYYRLIVVYELRVRTEDSNILFINTDKYDYKKCAEVYEFYACIENGNADAIDSNKTYNLGKRVRVTDFDSYSGEEAIDENDPHKDWTLGNFFVSGYTEDVSDADGNVVFLKNVGDKVTLWFRLSQDIDCLNEKENLSITADTDGYDEYFEKGPMNFGRGILFIRYTDRNNNESEVLTYTNYLEANAMVGADTKVQLFEEGDYEVALDYEITNDQLIDKVSHYRIFFKFSVRNGNCMVYPFDALTGRELTNSSMTENGFRLDLAKSRYLKVNLKREVLKDSADGLVEDTRFNGPAKEGVEYTDEGVYTITVTNEYTGQFTVKKIYVGTNSVLKAYMTTGLSIPEINSLVDQGATISDDGTIQLASITSPAMEETEGTEETTTKLENTIDENTVVSVDKEPEYGFSLITIVCIVVVCIAAGVFMIFKRMVKRQNQSQETIENEERGIEE